MGAFAIYYSFTDSTNIYQAWSVKVATCLNTQIYTMARALNKITIQLLHAAEGMMSAIQATPLVGCLSSSKSET